VKHTALCAHLLILAVEIRSLVIREESVYLWWKKWEKNSIAFKVRREAGTRDFNWVEPLFNHKLASIWDRYDKKFSSFDFSLIDDACICVIIADTIPFNSAHCIRVFFPWTLFVHLFCFELLNVFAFGTIPLFFVSFLPYFLRYKPFIFHKYSSSECFFTFVSCLTQWYKKR
jgi:hypothetical protein